MKRRLHLLAPLAVVAASLATTVMGATPALAASGPYGGSAFVDRVHLEAVEIPGTLEVADLSVAPAHAQVSSTGLAAPLAPANAHARATNHTRGCERLGPVRG